MENLNQKINNQAKKLPYVGKLDCLFSYFRSGKIFRQPVAWLYVIIALAFLLAPIYNIINTARLFEYMKGGAIVGMILIYILSIIGGVIGCMYWIDKSSEVSTLTSNDEVYVATPIVAHLIRCVGESVGMITILIMPFIVLVAMLFTDGMGGQFSYLNILTIPIGGFVFILITRLVGELISALSAIANNTAKR